MKSLCSLLPAKPCAWLLALLICLAPPVAAAELSQAIAERIPRVGEFQAIREKAAELGVRVWLFGGTAAGFGHYVNWDLRRESGDLRFQPNRFDYDYTNIYRSTQDLDLVMDGTPEQAAELQRFLESKFRYFQGSKSAWEVRLLRKSTGDKEALLDNPEFLNQHTDSNSTGMIEISVPPEGEATVRDLRDWQSRRPHFLEDLREGKLHYYHSSRHRETERFRKGMNPAIFSVVRYLTKAFQYGLEVRDEDLVQVRREIAAFDPASDLADPYARKWIEKNGKKLFQHAVDLEYATNVLDRLGLREKLTGLSDPQEKDSLGWWLSREPLRSVAVGQGTGKTAQKLKLKIVAHETSDFLAYESITRAHTGVPNVFVSRAKKVGESAAYGNGFYTARGRKGARGTGITIRFEVDPAAREGTDFTYVESEDYVVFHNRNAIRVIPESLNFTVAGYLRFLLSSGTLSLDDRALLEKLKRRVSARFSHVTPAELAEIDQVLKEVKIDSLGIQRLVVVWPQIESGESQNELLHRVLRAANASTLVDAWVALLHDVNDQLQVDTVDIRSGRKLIARAIARLPEARKAQAIDHLGSLFAQAGKERVKLYETWLREVFEESPSRWSPKVLEGDPLWKEMRQGGVETLLEAFVASSPRQGTSDGRVLFFGEVLPSVHALALRRLESLDAAERATLQEWIERAVLEKWVKAHAKAPYTELFDRLDGLARWEGGEALLTPVLGRLALAQPGKLIEMLAKIHRHSMGGEVRHWPTLQRGIEQASLAWEKDPRAEKLVVRRLEKKIEKLRTDDEEKQRILFSELQAWMQLPVSARHPKILLEMLKSSDHGAMVRRKLLPGARMGIPGTGSPEVRQAIDGYLSRRRKKIEAFQKRFEAYPETLPDWQRNQDAAYVRARDRAIEASHELGQALIALGPAFSAEVMRSAEVYVSQAIRLGLKDRPISYLTEDLGKAIAWQKRPELVELLALMAHSPDPQTRATGLSAISFPLMHSEAMGFLENPKAVEAVDLLVRHFEMKHYSQTQMSWFNPGIARQEFITALQRGTFKDHPRMPTWIAAAQAKAGKARDQILGPPLRSESAKESARCLAAGLR